MIYLLLSILSSTVIFITFKVTERFKTNLVNLITINYLAAAILGFRFNRQSFSISGLFSSDWILYALIIGVSYILMFFLMGYSVRKSGMAVTTIAGKLSMVIPILFSVMYFGEKVNTLKIAGLTLAIVAVLLTSYRPVGKAKNMVLIALPLAIFAGTGMTDSLVKYAQSYHVSNRISLLFSSVVFLSALISGLLFILLKPKSSSKTITLPELIGGVVLGIANFGSLYFFILTLNNSKLDSSIVFGLNNMCIVLFSILIGWTLFKEKFSNTNFAGVIMAFIAILILMNF